MSYYIDASGNYYEGDKVSASDVEVPQRPSYNYKWDGGQWVLDLRDAALQAIQLLEQEQQQRITARAQRELYLGIFTALNLTAHPAFAALKKIDDDIKVEREKI